jgi:hypothetical protein
MLTRGLALALIVLTLGCVSGHCRQNPKAITANPSESPSGSTATTESAGATSTVAPGQGSVNASQPAPNNPTAPTGGNVIVYKEDGSLQCAMGKPVKLEVMEKDLKGIPVLAREKKSDGMMRIQLCGAPTGTMNTYKIPANRLSDAEKLGFKKWSF